MPMVISPESDIAKEYAKWETPRSQGGMRPDTFEPYPRMLYQAQMRRGKVVCMDAPMAYPTDAEQLEVESFNRRCTRIVRSESEYQQAKGVGWFDTAQQAIDAKEKEQQDIANLAAERAFHDQRMSAQAREEVKAVEQQTHEHVVDVVAKKKPRGRPFQKKVQAAPVTASDPHGERDAE